MHTPEQVCDSAKFSDTEVELKPGICDCLAEAMSKLGQLERALRKGATDSLKKLCVSTAKSIADEVWGMGAEIWVCNI